MLLVKNINQYALIFVYNHLFSSKQKKEGMILPANIAWINFTCYVFHIILNGFRTTFKRFCIDVDDFDIITTAVTVATTVTADVTITIAIATARHGEMKALKCDENGNAFIYDWFFTTKTTINFQLK
ncbi:unnamed protein product [Adineta ricciae]|uniref:Uncharacterized protein n=1 Tax=Adineta ricciae TaxID=249248 RepID=A0A815UXU3_ADIRI|nr:unnamed protein product [Adineta ricciae]